jgi:hypothetical protein
MYIFLGVMGLGIVAETLKDSADLPERRAR